ncbi:MAG TPA: VanW family protein [Solirubrobacteraceae bacterium]|nr:VanW family protein [Solirubrobacteraceae bacterium]
MNGPRPRLTRRRRQLAAGAAIVLLGLLALALGVRMTHGDRILPGVRVDGVGLGGLSTARARRRLESLAAEAAGRPLALVAGDKRLTIAPQEAGYVADVRRSVERAMDSGRDAPLGGLGSTLLGLVATRDLPLEQHVDRRRLERTVASVAGRLGHPSSPGELVVDPGTLAVSTKAPRSGREVDRAALTSRLADALTARTRAGVEVPLRTRPVASRAAVDAVARAGRDYLREPLRLRGAGEPRDVSPAKLAGVLALVSLDGGRAVRLGANDSRLATLVEQIAAKRDRPARDAQIEAAARVVTFDAKGDATWRPRPADVRVLEPARPGRTIDRAKLTTAIEAAIREDRHAIELPIRHEEPAVSAAAARRMDSLIGTFTTYYVPGQPRVRNIQQIARDVDGTVVAPGARFSLNASAGQRTKDGGYVEAPFIADGKIEPSIGGGVSQFSTTLYNAAYFAGLQIDGHRPHSFFIDRYPAGREATLNFPDIDMTWTNDTRAPVLIRTSTDANSVAVSLYGNNGGRRASARAGDRDPLDDGDFAITITRVVRYRDGRIARQPFTTRYDKPPEDH